MPTGSLGDLGWTSITTTDVGITGISDRSETNPDDSMYLRRAGGALRATRIADPRGGHVNLDDRYGVSKNGRVVYVSGELKNGTTLSPIGAAMPGNTLFDGLAASDSGSVIVVRTNDRTAVSYNAGAPWGSVTGFGPGQASGAVVSRDGSDVYLGYSYNIYRLSGTTAKLYGNIRSRLLSLPSHPTVQLIATSTTGGKLFATAYKSGYPNFQNMYLLETKYHPPKLKKGLRIIGKAQVGKRLRARKPVARAGHYTCTVSWKAGKKHVSNKTRIRVKRAWRHKLLTVKATCRSASHADFTRKKSVRVR